MKVENQVYPDRARQAAYAETPAPDGPIVMVNLLRFRPTAQYRDGSDAHLTGREAYQRYAVEVGMLVQKYEGRVVYMGDVTALQIENVEDLWDEVALVEYPSRAAFNAMTAAPEWQTSAKHREAGLAGQLNIETSPAWPPKRTTAA